MNRGGSYGGGQSSLGYLFGGAPPDNDKHNKRNETPPPSPICAPPYGIDSDVNTTVTKPPPPPNSPGNTFERTLSQNSGNFAIAVSHQINNNIFSSLSIYIMVFIFYFFGKK